MPTIALQTYTIRKNMGCESGIRESFAKMTGIGIGTIELACMNFSNQNIANIAAICKEIGIEVGSVQIKLSKMEKDHRWLSKMLCVLNCQYVVVSVISFSSLRKGILGLSAYCEKLNDMGTYFKEQGIKLLYHHHHYEFVPVENVMPIDFIMENTDPTLVGLCADTYWIQREEGTLPHLYGQAKRGCEWYI